MPYTSDLAHLKQLRVDAKAAEAVLRAKAEKLFDLYRPMKAEVSTWSSKWHSMHLHRISYGENKVSYTATWGECEVTYVDLPSDLMDCDEAGMKAGIVEVLEKEGQKYERQAARREEARKKAEEERLQKLADELGYTLSPK